MRLEEVTFERMQSLVNTSFWAEFPNGAKVELRATHVTKVMESESAQLVRTPFSTFFLGPLTFLLKQNTYMVNHETFGAPMPIFLVPVAQQPEGYIYEAVFT